jgi:hypothetical protein
LGVKSFELAKLVKRFGLLSLKLTLKLKSILSLAKSKGDYIKLISALNTLNKEAIKLPDLIKEVHLFKIKAKRTLLINLLYNLVLSNLKKSKEPFKQILVNLLQDLALSNLKKFKEPFIYTLSNLENFKKLIAKLKRK